MELNNPWRLTRRPAYLRRREGDTAGYDSRRRLAPWIHCFAKLDESAAVQVNQANFIEFVSRSFGGAAVEIEAAVIQGVDILACASGVLLDVLDHSPANGKCEGFSKAFVSRQCRDR